VRTVHLFRLDFVTDTSIEELAETLVREGADAQQSWKVVVTPNVDHLIHYRDSTALRHVAESAHLVLPDGTPIVWASRLLGEPLTARLAGSDLFESWWEKTRAEMRPVLIIAASDELATRLAAEHSAAHFIVPKMFDAHDEAAVEALVALILADLYARPSDAIVVGLSMPKHHAVAQRLSDVPVPPGGAPLVLLLGASAEFHVGLQRRAPAWMQRAGLEWLYRLVSHPRRLARRYLVDDIAFGPMVWREWRTRRSRSSISR
jgi:N-acetylglucosaminyldiphosphoundecaprenol N-acetyl-beta-D-mannosaminyltransferase